MKILNAIFLNIIFLVNHTAIQATVYWDWKNINISTTSFPKNFEWGATTLSYEVDGCARSSTWYAHEKHDKYSKKAFVQENSYNGSDHWNHYKEDIQLMKMAGLTTYCFSIDWSKVEPEEGFFDEEVLRHYADFCDELLRNNIQPIVILKDYCDPLWFGYLGGFENEANIQLFERYCSKVFETLQYKVDQWITFWAPEGYAMLGYLVGSIPPGTRNVRIAFQVLKNELEAHVRVYKTLKSTSKNKGMLIGIIKHMHLLEPWYPWDRATCYIANKLVNDSLYNFFITGSFDIKIPLPGRAGAWIHHHNSSASKSIDFIGINYHSHGYIKNLTNHIGNPSEIPTDAESITLYPEGLYLAIKDISQRFAKKLDIPIYITQNGIATTDESIRDLYLKRHLYAVSKAIQDGYDVRCYCYYSLIDGHSWGSYNKKFGLFSVDRITLDRIPKTGSRYYFDIVNKSKR